MRLKVRIVMVYLPQKESHLAQSLATRLHHDLGRPHSTQTALREFGHTTPEMPLNKRKRLKGFRPNGFVDWMIQQPTACHRHGCNRCHFEAVEQHDFLNGFHRSSRPSPPTQELLAAQLPQRSYLLTHECRAHSSSPPIGSNGITWERVRVENFVW